MSVNSGANPPAVAPVARKRGAHRKSRSGCPNCKLRRVKCDETRPACKRCLDYGVCCSYDPQTADILTPLGGMSTLASPQIRAWSSSHASFDIIQMTPQQPPSILHIPPKLDEKSLDNLRKFQFRTLSSVGNPKACVVFWHITTELAYKHPMLMHGIQAVATLHDRHLAKSTSREQSIWESYHLSQAASLFHKKLSGPLHPSERDPLWAIAGLMGIMSFYLNDVSDPEESWPLRPESPNDLKWLQMSLHKTLVWNLTNPMRPDSLFACLYEDYVSAQAVVPTVGINGIPLPFVQLCELNESSSCDSSPYFVAVHSSIPFLNIKFSQRLLFKFLSFVSNMQPEYNTLLQRKEPRALLLFAYWCSLVCDSVWWLEGRAKLECRAICIYLERYHEHDAAIQALLQLPRMICGLTQTQVISCPITVTDIGVPKPPVGNATFV